MYSSGMSPQIPHDPSALADEIARTAAHLAAGTHRLLACIRAFDASVPAETSAATLPLADVSAETSAAPLPTADAPAKTMSPRRSPLSNVAAETRPRLIPRPDALVA